ncbi:DUF2125 domain-containing protein [Aquicoccus sp.]|uniref:DUF2125 domain-containing protein n=1 Tax=Aquicoccus sp. TaxID=2055851 RepID=UPI003569C588
MKRLLIFIIVAGLGWSGYWYAAMTGTRSGFETWFEARRAEGWQADYTDLAIRGFPNRVDATFENPALADPDSGLAWSAPFFQIFALTYRPNHVIAAWPETQRLSTPLAHYDITSKDMRASLVTEAAPSLPLERMNLVAGAMAITTNTGAVSTLDGVQAAVNRLPGATSAYRFAINADGLTPDLPDRVNLQAVPRRLDALRADIEVEFDAAWDLSALSEARPQPRRVRLRLAEARWGQLELKLAGTLDVDRGGRPFGQLTVKAQNWRDILMLARDMGWIGSGWSERLEQGLSLAAQLSGNPETLDIPLDFANGRVSLGPVPLGPAPVLRLR